MRTRSLASRYKAQIKRNGSELKDIKANLQNLAKDLECDQLQIDDETIYSGEFKSGAGSSDHRFPRSNRPAAVSPTATADSQMTTPEFKMSMSTSTVSSMKGGQSSGLPMIANSQDSQQQVAPFIKPLQKMSQPSLFKINLKSAF